MIVLRHATAEALLNHAAAFLEQAEVENGLILGLCAAPPEVGGCLWASVVDGERVVAVAIRTPPYNIALTRAPASAIEALARDVTEDLPGVTGPTDVARAFAEAWARGHDRTTRLTMEQRIYRLTQVIPPSRVASGALRVAHADDAPLVAAWMMGFAGDARLPEAEHAALFARARAAIGTGAVWLWETAGAPVSMAAFQGATRRGVRITMVYTPPELRGHGYASACVAALSAHALATGKQHCMLYTDLTNPTSNAIYQRLGYEPVSESAVIAFEPGNIC